MLLSVQPPHFVVDGEAIANQFGVLGSRIDLLHRDVAESHDYFRTRPILTESGGVRRLSRLYLAALRPP